MRKILSLTEFRKQAKGADANGLANAVALYKATPQVSRAAGDVKVTETGRVQVLNITSSDSSIDREDDTIRAAGWKLANYSRNPVVLWAHNPRILPVARAIRTEILGDKLQQDFEFTDADMQHSMGMGFGHTVGRMFQEGFLNAVSVGFSPLLWQFDEDRFGVDFLEQELLETSPVTIPANPNALAEAGKRMTDDGVDLAPVYEWAERCLDGDDGLTLVVPRKSIELTHSLLAKSLGKTERTFVDLGASAMPNAIKTRADNIDPKKEVGATEQKGSSLAAALNSRINAMVNDDRSRADIVASMASAAGIEAGTVNQILDASINCPPLARLEAFAGVLSVATGTLVSAAESDGCSYERGAIVSCALGDAAKAAAEASAKVEADAIKSIESGLAALKAIGGVTDKDSFKAIAERFAEFGIKMLKAPAEGGGGEPEQKTIKLLVGDDAVMLSEKDVAGIFERVGEVTQSTIATLTGRLS